MKKTFTARALTCVLLAAVMLFSLAACGAKEQDRVYGTASAGVTLKADGSFSANLYHSVSKAGTYTESESSAGVTVVTFTVSDGTTAVGTIQGKVLTIPTEWMDSHGHGSSFTLQ